jgi:hypothetical protein
MVITLNKTPSRLEKPRWVDGWTDRRMVEGFALPFLIKKVPVYRRELLKTILFKGTYSSNLIGKIS